MKTNIMAIVTATIAMIMTTTSTLEAKTPAMNFPISAPVAIHQVANRSKTYNHYYVTELGLTNRFEYTMDKRGRVISKVMYRQLNGEWTPRCIWRVTYGKTINVLSFAAWDSQRQEFSIHPESVAYDATENPVLLVLPE